MTLREIHALVEIKTEDYRATFAPIAILTSIYANVHRDKDKRARPFEPSDFIPGAEPTGGRVMTAQEMHAHAKAITAMFAPKRDRK